MVKYGTRDDLVWTCMFDKFDSGTLLYTSLHTSLHLAYLSLKVKVTVRECHSATVLSPTRVGLLRHVADKTVPAAASASPSSFVSFDYGRVINLYPHTKLQEFTNDYYNDYFWCTSGCPDGSWQASHSLLSGMDAAADRWKSYWMTWCSWQGREQLPLVPTELLVGKTGHLHPFLQSTKMSGTFQELIEVL